MLIKTLYILLVIITICGASLQLVYVLQYWNKEEDARLLIKIGFSLLLLVSLLTFVFVIDGFGRLMKLIEHDNLGISKQ